MRKIQKKMILELTNTFIEAHKSIESLLVNNELESVKMLLVDCQKTAVQIIDIIEKESKDYSVIASFREYCNAVFDSFCKVSSGNTDIDLIEQDSLLYQAKKDIENIKVKYEIAFFPYKASMWDSLESIWKAADADPDCEAYVVPIPYYDRNPDHSMGKFHYEGNEYPDYVPVIDYKKYNHKVRRPDIVYIHNPYDGYNYVTTVHGDYYSAELKKYTDMLVYVPYYATSGGMSEGQAMIPSYDIVDYIVIQSEKYRRYFDSRLDDKKFLPYGSPKFDRAISICKNPPEAPEDWKPYTEGKKVYFFNTSISGLLNSTRTFLVKLAYVFDSFMDRNDAVIIWRPHPLLESTLKSMRPQYLEVYEKLKKDFIENKIGIYDDTPDIEKTIALCYGYIGDTGTSVTSLFGVAGKPIFSFNNYISNLPEEYDYCGSFLSCFGLGTLDTGSNYIPYLNTLFEMKQEQDTIKFRKICRLSKYYFFFLYSQGIKIGNRIYVCPKSAQDIIVIENDEIVERIELEHLVEQNFAFECAYSYKNYIVIIPRKYPAIVRYNVKTGEIRYIKENINVFTGMINGHKMAGGSCIRNNILFIGSPVNNTFLAMNIDTCRTQVLTTCSVDNLGCKFIADDGEDLWFIPFRGSAVTRFNPVTGEHKDYRNMPEGFGITDYCEANVNSFEGLFSRPAVYGNTIYLPPARANMFVSINKHTNEVLEWKPEFNLPERYKSDYYINDLAANVKYSCVKITQNDYLLYSFCEGIFYRVNFQTGDYKKIKPEIDLEMLKETEAGFDYFSPWHQYLCFESAFNTLSDFLDDSITGKKFDKAEQLEAYNEINASSDGKCGEKVHEFIKKRCGD